MNRVLLITGGLLVGLLAALFVVPVFVDWTRYRGVFEEEATRLLGRDVRVGGRVNLRLLPSPYIRFEKVRIADTKAAVGEPLFRADDFTVWLSVSPLFRGDFEASVIELHKPVLTLVLDEKGGGNWTNLAEPAVKAAYTPAKIAFDNVRINNGTIAIYGATGEERTRFEHINGEFSSPAIDGPYKFAAAFAHAGAPREIRLSTARPEADGAIRLKGTVRAPASGVSYALDGKLMDLFQQPRLQGEVSAKLPLPAIAGPQTATPARGSGDASFDLKSALKADASGAEFSDVTLSFDQDGQPQLATGEARVVWRDSVAASVKLHSRWLDLDRISGRDNKTSLPEQLERLAKGLDSIVPATGQIRLALSLDQATLGGDVASGLAISAERKEGQLTVQAGATVPGGSLFDAQGNVNSLSADRLFDGAITLRGASASRFLAWAGRNTALPPIKRDGPFAIGGKATLGTQRIAGRELVIQFAGNNVTGDASWAQDSNGRQIDLALQGEELDLTPFVPPDAGPLAALKAVTAKLADLGATAGTPGAATPNITARLRIGQLTAGRTQLRDVTTDLRFAGGNLSIPLLQAGSDSGWSLEIRGDIADLAKPGAKGSVTWGLTAETAQGLQELLATGEFGDAWGLSPRRATALVPLHMAGRLRIGRAEAGAYDTAFDGNLGPTRASGTARLDAKGDSWRKYRTDVALTLDSGDIGRLMEQIAPEMWSPSSGSPSSGGAATALARPPGRIVLRGIGTPQAGLVSLASVETGGLAAEYRGKVLLTDTAGIGVEGDLRFAATDLAATLALAGIRERSATAASPMSGVVAVSGSLERLKFASARLDLGGANVSGRLELETRAAGNRLTGRLAASELSLPAMLGLLTVPRGAQRFGPPASPTVMGPTVMGPPPPPAQQSAWSEDTFELSPLANLVSEVRIEAANLSLAPDLSLGKSVVQIETKAGRLDIKLTEAVSLGGKLTGGLQLDRNPAGALAKATVRLVGAKLDAAAVAPGIKPAASGTLALTLDLEGTASSPRNLIAALSGKGQLSIGQGRLDRLGPRAIDETAAAMLAIKGEPPAGELGRRLAAALGGGTVAIGQRSVALDTRDGVLRLAPLALDTPDGRLTGTTSIDLEALRFDSEWRIEPKASTAKAETPTADPAVANAKPKAPLPGVVAVYAGPLNRIGAVEPRLQFDALEREIAVRKVERDLDELERLRKLDEERGRLEAERRKQLEATVGPGSPGSAGPSSSPPDPWPPATTKPASPSPSPAAVTAPASPAPSNQPAPTTQVPAAPTPLPPEAPTRAAPAPAASAPPAASPFAPPPVQAAPSTPPALIETPRPAAHPPATTNGAFVPMTAPLPPAGIELPPPNALGRTIEQSPAAAAPPEVRPAARPKTNPEPEPARNRESRSEPEPKPARKDVFGDQSRSAN